MKSFKKSSVFCAEFKYYDLMIYRTLLILSAFFLLISCEDVPQGKPFRYAEVGFQIPKNWQISAQDSSEEDYFSISIDMEAEEASGFVFVEWNDSLFTLKEVMDSTKVTFLNEPFFQKGGIEFEGEKEGEFAGQKALINHFKFDVQGIEYQGVLHSFQLPECNKTVMVIFQQQVIDQQLQEKDFQLIESSFGCQGS
jgi:hypothetical protein